MAMSKGCTIGLIILAVIVVIIIVGIILIWANRDKIMEAGLNYIVDTTEQEIVANIPEGYTPEMVHQIMDDFKAAVRNKEVDAAQIQELANTFRAAMDDKEIDKVEGRELLEMIQEALGQEPPPAPEEMPGEEGVDTLEAVPDTI